MHDISKFLPSEFIPYSLHDFSLDNPGGEDVGYYKPTETEDKAFDYAWLLHLKRNKHHWQFWTLPEDVGGLKVLEMPLKHRKEMLCDWIGAGKAQGRRSPKEDTYQEVRKWYDCHQTKLQLGEETRQWIEDKINYGKINKN